jgi:uncharacterized protein YecE (DUF72 family)
MLFGGHGADPGKTSVVEARIGTAGWSIPAGARAEFPLAGSLLERYAARFTAVEINSSFYRPHRPATYARWAAATPAEFRFAVKLPREISHVRRLADCAEPLARFLDETAQLGAKRGVILVQLPPSLAHDPARDAAFFRDLHARCDTPIACEPRHASWFTPEADALLCKQDVARIAADPAIVADASRPGGSASLAYFRLHGSPEMYRSAYAASALAAIAEQLQARTAPTWCIFDNTTFGAATFDALALSAA